MKAWRQILSYKTDQPDKDDPSSYLGWLVYYKQLGHISEYAVITSIITERDMLAGYWTQSEAEALDYYGKGMSDNGHMHTNRAYPVRKIF